MKETVYYTVPAIRLYNLLLLKDMMPLSMAKSPAFRKLISDIHSMPLSDRKSFSVCVDKLYDQMVESQ